MHLPPLFFLHILLLTLSAWPAATTAAAKPRDAILLSEVQSLTLRGGDRHTTTHRRVSAIPQLSCINSNSKLCTKHKVDVMRCENKGSSYGKEDIEWSCSAQLPPELKLGSTDVICEGYSSPDDPYILKGSCGVQYRLMLTSEGEAKWPDLAGGGGGGFPNMPSTDSLFPFIFWLIFGSVLVYILVSIFRGANNNNNNNRPVRRAGGGDNGGWGGGGGGGGGGSGGPGDDYGWDDPPPPYSAGSGGRRGGGRKTGSSSNWGPFGGGSSGNGSNWQSNLAAGAAGAAAGYFAGSRGRNNNSSNRSNAAPNYGSSWGGGAGPSRSFSSGSSSGSAASASRYESTGFGSTSRR